MPLHPLIADWINTEFRKRVLHDPDVVASAMAQLKVGVDRKDPATLSMALAISAAVLDVAGIDPKQAVRAYSSEEVQSQRIGAVDELLMTYMAVHQATCASSPCDHAETVVAAIAHRLGITTKARVANLVARLEHLNVACPCCSKERN